MPPQAPSVLMHVGQSPTDRAENRGRPSDPYTACGTLRSARTYASGATVP
jgi:hypothetical protein